MRPRALLPNRVGFRFLGVFKDGIREAVVIRDANGYHTVEGFIDLLGWYLVTS